MKIVGILMGLALFTCTSSLALAQVEVPKEEDGSKKKKKKKCPEGQEKSDYTDGHCCWPEQEWSKKQDACIGIPTCPEGFYVDGESCFIYECYAGMERSDDTEGNCCWPRQEWSTKKGQCIGIPDCPNGFFAEGEWCVESTASGSYDLNNTDFSGWEYCVIFNIDGVDSSFIADIVTWEFDLVEIQYDATGWLSGYFSDSDGDGLGDVVYGNWYVGDVTGFFDITPASTSGNTDYYGSWYGSDWAYGGGMTFTGAANCNTDTAYISDTDKLGKGSKDKKGKGSKDK